MTTSPDHPARRRYLAEDLVRRRRSDEQRRYSAPQRAARIDANPHQVDAVIFALSRIREGGCILADEVGLGKTIEAGLVMAQLLAEGARRVLLIAPKPLVGQWRQELYQLFGIESVEAQPQAGPVQGPGVFLVGREAAGSEKARHHLLASDRFDLCVIDEAHEIFAGIYRRFDEFGAYDQDAPTARIAGRVREVLTAGNTPVLLLTATPIQNSLVELWGLVQYVDPLGTLLGDLPTFREVFCGEDDRQLAPGQDQALRARLRAVLQRTLRRDAQEFLERPFVNRETRLFDYTMSPAEKALYDDVTQYLLEPGIVAFRGVHRRMIVLLFHRLLASSTHALAASLAKVAARLRRTLAGEAAPEEDDVSDLEDEDLPEPAAAPAPPAPSGALEAEILRLEGLVQRARSLAGDDGKFRALLQALGFVTERARRGLGAGKLVIFTESLVTQEHLRDHLIESGMVRDEELTLFRGSNDSPRARAALERWRQEVPQTGRPSTEIATRLALVHEFRTRSRVFISTEAGAKGLNLQFCDTLVNYDLPWNPQRIEQRIGRCHRYGQQRDVTVINFRATDNEAQALTVEILTEKLQLFGTVLDASDQVLHRGAVGGDLLASALGGEYEAELGRIYERSRSADQINAEMRALREKMGQEGQRFQATHARTADLIERRLDEGVQGVFRSLVREVPRALVELDRDLLAVVTAHLQARGVAHRRVGDLLEVGPCPPFPDGVTAAIGPSREHASLHLGHPLVAAAVADARAAGSSLSAIVSLAPDAPAALRAHAGRSACLRLVKVSYEGFEQVELLIPVVVLDDGETLAPALGEALLRADLRPLAVTSAVTEDQLADATAEALFALQSAVDAGEQQRFERARQQADHYLGDRLLVLQRRRQALEARLEQARQRRDGAVGSEARTDAEREARAAQVALDELDEAIARLERHDDERFRRFSDHIHQRRYTPPVVERLFDLALVIS